MVALQLQHLVPSNELQCVPSANLDCRLVGVTAIVCVLRMPLCTGTAREDDAQLKKGIPCLGTLGMWMHMTWPACPDSGCCNGSMPADWCGGCKHLPSSCKERGWGLSTFQAASGSMAVHMARE
jgi:hypothetical protein